MPSSDAAHEKSVGGAVPGSAPSWPPSADEVIAAFAGADNIIDVKAVDHFAVVRVRDTTKVSEADLHDLGFVGAVLEGDDFALLGLVDAAGIVEGLDAALEGMRREASRTRPRESEES